MNGIRAASASGQIRRRFVVDGTPSRSISVDVADTPLRLPEDLDFTALFHGVDERVPTDALEFGARVFDRFLDEV